MNSPNKAWAAGAFNLGLHVSEGLDESSDKYAPIRDRLLAIADGNEMMVPSGAALRQLHPELNDIEEVKAEIARVILDELNRNPKARD